MHARTMIITVATAMCAAACASEDVPERFARRDGPRSTLTPDNTSVAMHVTTHVTTDSGRDLHLTRTALTIHGQAHWFGEDPDVDRLADMTIRLVPDRAEDAKPEKYIRVGQFVGTNFVISMHSLSPADDGDGGATFEVELDDQNRGELTVDVTAHLRAEFEHQAAADRASLDVVFD